MLISDRIFKFCWGLRCGIIDERLSVIVYGYINVQYMQEETGGGGGGIASDFFGIWVAVHQISHMPQYILYGPSIKKR